MGRGPVETLNLISLWSKPSKISIGSRAQSKILLVIPEEVKVVSIWEEPRCPTKVGLGS